MTAMTILLIAIAFVVAALWLALVHARKLWEHDQLALDRRLNHCFGNDSLALVRTPLTSLHSANDSHYYGGRG